MANLVDGHCFGLPELSLLIKRILFEEKADVVGAFIEVLVGSLRL